MGGPKMVGLYSCGTDTDCECNGLKRPNWGQPNKG